MEGKIKIETIRHTNVHGKEEYYLRVGEGTKQEIITVGKSALEKIESVMTPATQTAIPINSPK